MILDPRLRRRQTSSLIVHHRRSSCPRRLCWARSFEREDLARDVGGKLTFLPKAAGGEGGYCCWALSVNMCCLPRGIDLRECRRGSEWPFAQIGIDIETQIEEGELFDFDVECEPVLEATCMADWCPFHGWLWVPHFFPPPSWSQKHHPLVLVQGTAQKHHPF